MVTTLETRERVEAQPITLEELGERIGVPIKVRRWWGSVRQPRRLDGSGGYWECPAGSTYSRIKWPEVQKGVVLLWEGPCRYRRYYRMHNHRQSLEILDTNGQALLLCISVSTTTSHFLIGMDNGHPFVAPVLRRLTTVQDAFDWLVPKPVWQAMVLGLDVKRQGDWFFIPFNRPVWEDQARPWYGLTRHAGELGLVYTHVPLMQGYSTPTRHIADRVIFRSDGWPLVRGTVTAPDHPPIHLQSWHRAIRTRSTPGGSRDGPGCD